jgi:AraC-like DNA-binding protein
MPSKKRKIPRGRAFTPTHVPHAHAGLAAEIPYFFEALELSVSRVDARGWHVLHVLPNVVRFEQEHGHEQRRNLHNQRCMAEAVRTRDVVVGRHAGFFDVFAPIVTRGAVEQMLVAGPFREARLTSGALLEQYRALTRRHGNLGDPEFIDYLEKSLATPIFEGADLQALERLMRVCAALFAESRDAKRLASELESAKKGLQKAAFTRRMWIAARSMVNPLETRVWRSYFLSVERGALGLRRLPEHALVGLVAGRKDEPNPIDEAIRRAEFQRACVGLAASLGNVATAPVASHGVMFLMPEARSASAARTECAEIVERVATLARQRFGLRVHFGSSLGAAGSTLPVRYRAALASAERALAQGVRSVHADESAQASGNAAREMRAELAKLEAQGTEGLGIRFDRYIDVVASESHYRAELAAVHLATGLERLAEPFLRSGALSGAVWREMWTTLDAAGDSVRAVHDLFAAYRAAVADLEAALRDPTAAHQERSLRRAMDFIREHVAEPLSRAQVARIAGFEPHYFSRLFKRREKLTFENYLTKLRLERAEQMLARTSLSAERIAQLSGFSSSQYFHQVFKRTLGETPLQYRKRVG